MQIRQVHPRSLQSWDRYVFNHPRGLACQLSAYTRAVKQAYAFDTRYLAAFSGSRIRGVLALTRMGLPGLPGQWISSPYCDAAGILADNGHIEAALLERARALAKETGASGLALRNPAPFSGIHPDLTAHPGKVRMVLELKPDPVDLMASLKAKVRSQVKKPMRDGLAFFIGGRELIRPFYRIYSENMRDLGSPPHPLNWFRRLMSAYGNGSHIGIVRLSGGTPAAAGLILSHPRTVSIPWASSLRRYNRMNPNMLLYWGFLAFAAGQGAAFFDFGRSTPGEGTYRFKAQWGAKPVPLHWAAFNTRTDHPRYPLPLEPAGSTAGLRSTAEKILSSMPVPVTTLVGQAVRKYIPL